MKLQNYHAIPPQSSKADFGAGAVSDSTAEESFP
jgi:hypothetical protein